MSVILHVEIYEKLFHVHLNNLHSTAMAFYLSWSGSLWNKIVANDSSGSRSACLHSCTGELKITVDRSICVNSVYCLESSFSVLQKLEVVQGTKEYSYFRD